MQSTLLHITVICNKHIFIREAGLQAVVISGVARQVNMDMTDIRSQVMDDSWVAVHVEADWQLVHPEWICKVTCRIFFVQNILQKLEF